jgi:SAM-dependent methyltransferase
MKTALQANRTYFRQAYRSGQHGWETSAPSPHAVSFLKRLKRLLPGGRLLDLGCGEGRHAIAAARLGFKVTGVDFEPLALKRARRFAAAARATGIEFKKANALRLPFRQSSFDIVLDYGCLHHQRKSDWPAYLAGILRVLKPRGFYVLSVFSPVFLLFRATSRPWHIADGAYRRRFTRADISELFGRDFEILKLFKANGNRPGFWHLLARRRAVTERTWENGDSPPRPAAHELRAGD